MIRRFIAALGLVFLGLVTFAPGAHAQTDPVPSTTEPGSPSAGQVPVDPAATGPNAMGIRSYGNAPLSWYEVGCDPDGKDPSILDRINPISGTKRGFESWVNGLKCDNMNMAAQGGWIFLGGAINAMQWVLELPVVDYFGGEIDSLSARLNAPLVTPLGNVTITQALWLMVGIAFAWWWFRSNPSRSWMHLGVALALTTVAAMIGPSPSAFYAGTVGVIRDGVQTIYTTSGETVDPNTKPGETLASKLYVGLIDPMWEGVNFGSLPPECQALKPELLRPWGTDDEPRKLLEKAGCHDAAEYQSKPTTWRMIQSWGVFWSCIVLGGLLYLLAGALAFSLVFLAAVVAMMLASVTLGIGPPLRKLPVMSVRAYLLVVFLAFAGAVGMVVTGTFVAAVAVKANESNMPFGIRFVLMPIVACIGIPIIGGARHFTKKTAHESTQRILGERRSAYKATPVLSKFTDGMREVPGLDHAVSAGEKGASIGKKALWAGAGFAVGNVTGAFVGLAAGTKAAASNTRQRAAVSKSLLDDRWGRTTEWGHDDEGRWVATHTYDTTAVEEPSKVTKVSVQPERPATVEVEKPVALELPAAPPAPPEPVEIEPLGWAIDDIGSILDRNMKKGARLKLSQRPDDRPREPVG